MTSIIKRAEGKITEINKICEEIKQDLNILSVLDMNNEYQSEQKISTSELNCRKLSTRCNDVFKLLQTLNLEHMSDSKAKKEHIFAKGSLSTKDIDEIVCIFDEIFQELDNLEFEQSSSVESVQKADTQLPPKIFISHSSNDKKYVQAIVELFEDIGIKEDHLFCSSLAEYGIPLNSDIYDYLKAQFKEYSLNMIFVLSDEYYRSPACLNEMGAAWILQSTYTTMLLPNFEFKNIQGAINPSRISIKLDNQDVSARLNELKDNIVRNFGLPSISQTRWERHRDAFIAKIQDISKSNQ